MRPLVLICVLALTQAVTPPESFPLEDFGGEGGVKATVNGKSMKVAFDATWVNSRIVGKTSTVAPVQVGGKARVTIPLLAIGKEEMPDDADAVLGVDALRKMTLAFDPQTYRVEFLDGTKIGEDGARRYFARLPKWDGASQVVRLPLVRDKDGTPLLGARVGGKALRFALRLAPVGSITTKAVPHPPSVASAENWDFLAGVSIANLEARWTAYQAQDDYDSGGDGMLGLDVFGSRRVVFDLADDAIYIERLSPDACLSLALFQMTRLPLLVKGKSLMLGLPPGETPPPALETLPDDIEVVSIAGVLGGDWIADLRSKSPEAVMRVTKRLSTMSKGYDVTYVDGEGDTGTFKVPAQETPAPRASLRAAGPARAASSSR